MGADSKIEWTDHTFNPWIGCRKVSPGCVNCYAENSTRARVLRSRGHETWGKGAVRSRTSADNWKEPLRWNKAAEKVGTRPRVFCASLADWLDDEVPVEWLLDLLKLIYQTPNLDWLLLTKRPENFVSRFEAALGLALKPEGHDPHFCNWLTAWHCYDGCKEGEPDVPPENVWIGTTVEDQTRADLRIPLLLEIPAKVRFLSCEPLLGDPFLGDYLVCELDQGDDPHWQGRTIDWVICGGESGSEARPMDPDWARSIRDQCVSAGVPFFFKQWGNWSPSASAPVKDSDAFMVTPRAEWLMRSSKKAAGRLLDGREWNGMPVIEGRRRF